MRSRQAQVFLLSAAVICHQLALMRALCLARSHHFAYLVIGVALLGFGASGVALRLALPAVRRRPVAWKAALYSLACLCLPLGYTAAMALPLDLPYLLHGGGQVPLLFACVSLLLVPFFLMAFLVGLELAGPAVPGVYAANLWGGCLGSAAGIGFAAVVPTLRLPFMSGVIVLAAFVTWAWAGQGGHGCRDGRGRVARLASAAACAVLSVAAAALLPDPGIDPYKALAGFQQLERQGDAAAVAVRSGPRGQVDVYESPLLHQALFAGIQATALPPPQLAVFRDGDLAGVAFTIDRADDAAILDATPQSLAYRLVDTPRVLILGEVGGTNIWLARRFGAASVTVVQGHPGIVELLTGELAPRTGGIFTAPMVTVVREEPRSFVERSRGTWDVIHVASSEGMPAGSGGLLSLGEDWLLTTRGIAACLRLLSDRGVLSATRGIQQPPRDGIRMFALFEAGLRAGGEREPAARLLQARNYLAVTTMASRSALDAGRLRRFAEAAEALLMDREYYPGIDSAAVRQLNVAPGPVGSPWSWYHEAARSIVSGEGARFAARWVYRTDAPTDDRPYFHDFFKGASIGAFVRAYGEAWLGRLEMGRVVVAGTVLVASALALAMLLLPAAVASLAAGARVRRSTSRLPAALHFAGIGAGFMLVEMVMLQKLTRLLGDPVVSAAVVIGAMLFFSGCGSALVPRLARGPLREPQALIRAAALAVVAVGAVYLPALDPLITAGAALPAGGRLALAILLLFPLCFPLGLFFPSGVQLLQAGDPGFVPMAWGINGFASVVASPLAVLVSMSLGFTVAMACGIGLYAVVGAVSLAGKKAA